MRNGTLTLQRFLSTRLYAGTALAVLALSGCESDFLEYTDPDIIEDVNSASGAIALRNGVVQRFINMTNGLQGPDALFVYSGLLADEWRSGDTFEQRNQPDKRDTPEENTFLDDHFLNLHRVRTQGQQAVRALRQYAPSPSANIGLMFALTAFVENFAGEIYCNGIPFPELDEAGNVIPDSDNPVSVDSAFTRAIASADSALNFIDGAGGSTVENLAKVVWARALLNLNLTDSAAVIASTVPTEFVYQVTHSVNTTGNQIWALNLGARRYVLSDNEGGNGLPFLSAADPRVVGQAGDPQPPTAFDSQTPFVALLNYGQFDPVTAASGVEARLIEAEAALRGGDAVTWLATLNALRLAFDTDTATAGVQPMAPLVDPVVEADRVDLMFYERAFWMFSTGHRLGDLRRLIRQYGRSSEEVFPTGAFHKGDNYGPDVNLPIPFDERNNPNFNGCTNRAA
jgi:hypothetical protein